MIIKAVAKIQHLNFEVNTKSYSPHESVTIVQLVVNN